MSDYIPKPIQLQLTKGYIAIIDEQDADLAEFKWSSLITPRASVYAWRFTKIEDQWQHVLLHRLILERILNRRLIKGELCDHENGEGTDNRRENLRLASSLQNAQNKGMRKDNTSGFKGVSYRKDTGRYVARIYVNKLCIRLGNFATAEDASDAYKQAAIEFFGNYANLGDGGKDE